MANVLFKKGTLANLSSQTKVPGTIYVTTDEHAMYLDTSSSERIRLGDFQEYASWAAIQALPNEKKVSTVLYYAQAENILCKWTGSAWTQINPDTIIKLTEMHETVTAASGGVTVTTEVSDSKGSVTGSFGIVGNGATTVSLAEGKVQISSTDSSTTKAGHYTPSEEAGSKLSASENSAITGIKRDSKGHITGFEETPFSTITSAVAITDVSLETSGSSNNINLTASVAAGGDAAVGNVRIAGDGAVTVSQNNPEGSDAVITISSTDQSVTDVGHHYTPSGASSGSHAASGATGVSGGTVQVVTGVTTDAAGHVTGITSGAAKDTLNDVEAIAISPKGSSNNGFEVSAKTDAGGSGAASSFDPTVTIGNNSDQVLHFVNGTATLPVYTKTETDTAITTALGAANALVIKGELSGAASSLPTTNVQAGDTYIVTYSSGLTVVVNGNEEIKAEAGDLFVAKQDMASGSTNANWYYVPAGNDLAYLDTAVTAGGKGFSLKTKADNIVSGEVLFSSASTGDAGIVVNTVTDTVDSYNQTTITLGMQWGEF